MTDLDSLLKSCVHCGFCLPACPTYLLWGEEMDSPRGRLHLMKAVSDGRAPIGGRFTEHMDACLGCLACVDACPSGVEYGVLIEAARARIEQSSARTTVDRLYRRLLFAVLPFPTRLRWLTVPLALWVHARPWLERCGIVERLPSRLRALASLAPTVTSAAPLPPETPAVGPARGRVGLLTGCVQRVVFADVNRATANVLSAEGYDVVAPVEQGCCGALSLHAGFDEQARQLARRLIDTFESTGTDRIVVNVAGCGSAMKDYGRLMADDPEWAERARAFSERVRDISEMLAENGSPRAPRHPLAVLVAYHDACHLAHAQGVREQPRAMLASIPELRLVPIPETDICCGSAGIYNLVQPVAAAALGDRKMSQIATVTADMIATANAGCLLQIASAGRRARRNLSVLHPIQLVDASIRGVAVTDVLSQDF